MGEIILFTVALLTTCEGIALCLSLRSNGRVSKVCLYKARRKKKNDYATARNSYDRALLNQGTTVFALNVGTLLSC